MASNEFKLILNLILPKGSKSHILPRKNEFARIHFKKYILYGYIWRMNLEEYILHRYISRINLQEYISRKIFYMNTSEQYPEKMHVSLKVAESSW